MEAAPSCAQQIITGKNVDSGKAKRIRKQSEQTAGLCQTLTQQKITIHDTLLKW